MFWINLILRVSLVFCLYVKILCMHVCYYCFFFWNIVYFLWVHVYWYCCNSVFRVIFVYNNLFSSAVYGTVDKLQFITSLKVNNCVNRTYVFFLLVLFRTATFLQLPFINKWRIRKQFHQKKTKTKPKRAPLTFTIFDQICV